MIELTDNFDPILYNQAYEESQEHRERVKHISAFTDEALEYLDVGSIASGDSLPWAKTQDKFRLRMGEVTLWVGQNGSGKSQLTTQIAVHLSITKKVGIASFEMHPRSTLEITEFSYTYCSNFNKYWKISR